jgi:hypothetical protein
VRTLLESRNHALEVVVALVVRPQVLLVRLGRLPAAVLRRPARIERAQLLLK